MSKLEILETYNTSWLAHKVILYLSICNLTTTATAVLDLICSVLVSNEVRLVTSDSVT